MYTDWRVGPVTVSGKSETAGQAAIVFIRDRIVAGDLPPGAKLNQHRLATQLGMSRIPVRDALRSLAAEGFVTFKANATAVVAPLSMEDLQELYEVRISLEPRLGRLAIPNLSERHYQTMEDMLEEMESVTETELWLPLNNRFHETLYSAAYRQRSLDIVRMTRRQTDRYTAVFIELNHAVVDAEHRMILDAARRGHGTRLEALITAHISSSYEQMLRYLAGGGQVPRAENTRVEAR
jgi:DNA-binding GntR family transcriptional regulator